MGSAKSKIVTNNTNKQHYISKTDVDIATEVVNEVVAEAIIKNNSSCSTMTDVSQLISFRGCRITGDLVIGDITQEAVVMVDFNCVNVFQAQQDMAQSMMNSLASEIQNKMDVESQNLMDTLAKSTADAALLGGSSNSTVETNNNFDLTVENQLSMNINTVLKNSIHSKFTTESIQECISGLAVKQTLDFSNCNVGGDLTIEKLKQNASVSNVSKCVNQSGVSQTIINDIANDLGVKVSNDMEADTGVKQVTDATSSATSSFFGSINWGMIIGVIVGLCVLALIIFILIKTVKSSSSSDGGDRSGNNDNDGNEISNEDSKKLNEFATGHNDGDDTYKNMENVKEIGPVCDEECREKFRK
jgi:large-conductance mechanosensitive channel